MRTHNGMYGLKGVLGTPLQLFQADRRQAVVFGVGVTQSPVRINHLKVSSMESAELSQFRKHSLRQHRPLRLGICHTCTCRFRMHSYSQAKCFRRTSRRATVRTLKQHDLHSIILTNRRCCTVVRSGCSYEGKNYSYTEEYNTLQFNV